MAHTGIDNIAFVSRHQAAVVEDAGDGLHTQRNALDSGYLLDVTENQPAPVRFLPQYDNVLLSHDDRSRFLSGEPFALLVPFQGSVLVDGWFFASWSIERAAGGGMTLVVHRVGRGSKADVAAVEAEGQAAIRFLRPDAASHDVRVQPAEATGLSPRR